MSRRSELILITLLLLLAAVIRIYSLARLPAGFSDEEIANLRIAETARGGRIGVFYNMETPGYRGHEAVFPLMESLTTGLIGDGLLCYRLISLWGGLLSVALVYALGRRLIGSAEGLIAGVVFAVGLLPMLLSRSVLAQSILLPVALTALLMLAQALYLRRDVHPLPPKTAAFTALGAFTTLAVYTHWTGLILVPIFTAFFVYLRVTIQPISRRVQSFSLYGLLVALILGIPYLTSTFRVPSLSGFGALWFQRPADIGALLNNLINLIFSVVNVGNLGLVGALLILTAIGLLLIGIVTAARNWCIPGYVLTLLAFIGGVLPAIWTGRGDFNLAIALPGAALLIGVGVTESWAWLKHSVDLPFRYGLVPLTPVFIVLALIGLKIELFDRYANDPAINRRYHGMLGNLAVYLDVANDDLPTLVCTDHLVGTPEQPVPDTVLTEMMMHRARHNLRFSNCHSAIILADGGRTQRIVFGYDADDRTPLILRDWLNMGGAQPISIPGMAHTAAFQINVERQLADAVGKLTLSHVSWPPDQPNAQDAVTLPVRMGDYLNFEGYSLDSSRQYKPGDIIGLTTYWRIDGPQMPDLRLFAHMLLDPGSEPAAQTDALDVAPAYLKNRDIIVQFSTIQLPYPFPDGTYYLSVGAYHDSTKVRVPVYDDHDQIRGARLFLDTISVKG